MRFSTKIRPLIEVDFYFKLSEGGFSTINSLKLALFRGCFRKMRAGGRDWWTAEGVPGFNFNIIFPGGHYFFRV